MKYIIKILLAAAASVSLLSCEREFKLKGLDTQPRAFIEFLPCGDDSSMVKLLRAYPSQMMIEDQSLNSFVEDVSAAVSIEVDGVPVTAKNDSISLAYVHRKFNPGETVTVRVDLGDGCIAESETVIPPAIRDFRFSRINEDVVLDYCADQYPEYMAIVPDYIVTLESTNEAGETTTTVRHGGYVLHFDTERKSDIANDMVIRLRSLRYGQSCIYYWKNSDSEKLENGWRRMRFHIFSPYYYVNVYEYDQVRTEWRVDETTGERVAVHETIHKKETYEHEFHICGIHEDLYRYMNNQLDMADNDYGHQGLAPTVFNWTNVKDGFGIVAGMSCVSTGWFQFDE